MSHLPEPFNSCGCKRARDGVGLSATINAVGCTTCLRAIVRHPQLLPQLVAHAKAAGEQCDVVYLSRRIEAALAADE
jgi:hypothetical protein